MQSMALKENVYEYVAVMLELFERLVNRVEIEDFKFILAQCFQWYQKELKTVKTVIEAEQKTTLFDEGNKDQFETGYDVKDKNAGLMQLATADGESPFPKINGLDTGGIRPSSAMLRDFGLPVPHDHSNRGGGARLSATGGTMDDQGGMINDPSSPLYDRRRGGSLRPAGAESQEYDFSHVKKSMERAISRDTRATGMSFKGEMMTDRFGSMKFREFDDTGRIKTNELIDMPAAKNESH